MIRIDGSPMEYMGMLLYVFWFGRRLAASMLQLFFPFDGLD